jgi:hypothetical protein
MIVLAASPWIALFVSEMTIMGNSIKFKVEENSRDIETLKLLIRSVLTVVELEVIANLRAGLGYRVNTGDTVLYPGMKAALNRLIGLGFLDDRKGTAGYKGFEDPMRMARDIKDYFDITESGRKFLERFEEAQGRPIDLAELDRITRARIE